MENLLKYFEVKYALKNIDESLVVSNSKMLQIFFTILLEYYYKNNILLTYSDQLVTDDIKEYVIKKVYPIIYKEKSVKLYDLVDFMFLTFKKTIIRAHTGYLKWMEDPDVKAINFSMIMPNIDIFFYIIFVHVLPEELRDLLRNELRISTLDYRILTKCGNILIKNNEKICDLKRSNNTPASSPISTNEPDFDSIKDAKPKSFNLSPTKKSNSLYLENPDGIMMLFKLFNDLRSFSNRRPSKLD